MKRAVCLATVVALASALIVLVVPSAAAGPPAVSSWNFNDGSSPTADGSGTNHLTLGGGATFANANDGKALRLDGIDDQAANLSPGTALPAGGSARSLAAWVRPDNTNPGGTVIAYGDGAGGGQEFMLQVFTFTDGNTYLFTDGVNPANNITISGAEIPPANKWSHMAFTFDGTNWKYYLNGSLTKSGTFSVPINTATATVVSVGNRNDGYSQPYPGLIDIAQIYGSVLSAADVLGLYDTGGPEATNVAMTTPARRPRR